MEPWEEIARYTRKLDAKGYMGSHSGNLSIRVGNRIFVKRRGAASDEIGRDDVVELSVVGESANIYLASTESYVHRAIYRATSALAIVHAHPPFSTVCSLLYDEILPIDEDGEYVLKKIPAVAVDRTSGSKELEERVSQALRSYKGITVRGHGTWAIANLLEDAYHITCMIEAACQIRYLVDASGQQSRRELRELRSW
ncbi:MAG: aldolase [Chloroflexi bacterium]|nr:aldolase [Chloroflexota bacterium]